MENKKNKKKLFAIIGASALAFILTIALSVSITLAYFGGKATGSTTVTLGGSVFINTDAEGATLSMTGTADDVLPGQTINVGVSGSIKSSTSQKAAVILLVEKNGEADVAITGFTGWAKSAKSASITTGETTKKYTVYVYGTDAKLTQVDATTAGTTVALAGTYTVPTTLKNDAADTAVAAAQINAIMVAVQYGTTGPVEGTWADLAFTDTVMQTIFADVAGCTFA